MDVATFRLSVAGLIGQLYALDPATGLPTTTPMTPYAHAPQSISETKLPCGIIFTGAGRYPNPPDQSMDRVARESRQFAIEFYLAMAEAGVDFWAEERAEPYLDYTRDWLQRHVQLWDGVETHRPYGVKRTYLLNDSGLTSRLRFTTATVKYLGIAYIVQVDADNEVTYATNQ